MEPSKLFDQMSDLMVCRNQDRTIQMVNPAFVSAFGKTPDEWVGLRLDGAVSGSQIGAFDEDRTYGHIEISGQLHWIEWVETTAINGGTLAIGRLNQDRRKSDRSNSPGRDCRRQNKAGVYREPAPLPVVSSTPESSPVAAPVAPAVAPPAKGAVQVLLAEDDLLNAKLARALLERSGCLVTHVENGVEAVEQASLREFDLVFMDMRMPKMDGLQATRALRKLGGNWQTIPIVALTANAFAEDKKSCHAAGMDGFLTKPISIDALEAARKRWTGQTNQAKTA